MLLVADCIIDAQALSNSRDRENMNVLVLLCFTVGTFACEVWLVSGAGIIN